MFKILKKKVLNPTVTLMEIEAPKVARKAEPGQFVILRTDEEGERMSLTIAYPVVKKFHEQGAEVHAIIGFRNKIWLFWKRSLKKIAVNFF